MLRINKLYSVRIIRRVDQAVSAVYIKEFFKFCGVYVDEFVLGYDEIASDNDYVDFNIILEDGDYLDKLKSRYTIHVNETQKRQLNLSSIEKRVRYGKKIEKELLQIPLILEWDEKWEIDFKRIYNAFVKTDFAYNNYLTHLYFHQFSDQWKLIQFEILTNCLNSICEVKESLDGLDCRKFAYFNCARKFNKIYVSLGGEKPFSNEIMMKKMQQMSDDDDKYSIGNVLAGLMGLSKKKLNFSGEMCMQQALMKEKNNRYSAFVYYTLANYYEEKDDEEALKLYREMEKVVPKDYKMLFALGRQALTEERKEEALEKLVRCFNITEAKINSGWATPDDLEYYYRCTRILNEIPQDELKMMGVSPTSEDIKKIVKEDFRKSKFVNNFIFNGDFKELYVFYFKNKINELNEKEKNLAKKLTKKY